MPIRRFAAPARLLALVGVVAAPAVGQPIGVPRPPSPERSEAVRPILDALSRATTSGAREEARRHLQAALRFLPEDPGLLARAVDLARDDDERLLAVRRLLAVTLDIRGTTHVPVNLRQGFGDEDAALGSLLTSRAAAVKELIRFARKRARSRRVGDPILVRFARSLAGDLVRDAPALRAEAAEALDPLCVPLTDEGRAVMEALLRLGRDLLGAGDAGEAVEVARCALGLAAQASFPKLKGPRPPGLDDLRTAARDLLERARGRLEPSVGEPLTIEDLEALDLEERLRFTREHSTFASPGVAWSRTRKYRIETICGFDTLLGIARTVELHHERLARWYGRDPFEGRPGIVRVVPEAADLEAEGAPFFWVGGFQSGDVTTVRFSASSLPALGRGLTHELTHRFDGATFGALPAWLLEGRAVWTAAAYGPMDATAFVPNHCVFGTMDEAARRGYGAPTKLAKLVEGTIDDYRDNYVAGYALYVYLNTWPPDGEPLYRARLESFQAGYSEHGRKNPRRWFEKQFCDGREGRPESFRAFAKGFASFLRGFYWLDRAPWTKAYTEKAPGRPRPPVLDAPTWQFSRRRAEPWFGERQAARAGALLLRHGRKKDAARALVWGHTVDEWSVPDAVRLAAVLSDLGEKDAAWVILNELRRRVRREDLPLPGRSPLPALLPRCAGHVQALRTAARAAGEPRRRSRAAFLADARALADRLGIPTDDTPDTSDARPFERPAHVLGSRGLVEDELSGYDEHRVPGLFYEDDAGVLHVGRKRPREATGALDRNAGFHHAFVRGREWLRPGRYRIRVRISLTTTYVDGALVIGYTRRDRNLRLSFVGGDYLYSIGQKNAPAKLDSVFCSLDGLRDGEGPWGGQTAAARFDFDPPRNVFSLEVLIDGPVLVAAVDGRFLGAYHTPDGQPIEGYVGFADSFGAYSVPQATIEPLDRERLLGIPRPETRGLTLDDAGEVSRERLLNRPVHDVPLGREGTLVVWMPPPDEDDLAPLEDDEALAFERRKRAYAAVRSAEAASEMLWKGGFGARLVLALPAFLSREDVDVVRKELRERGVEARLVVHHKTRSFTGEEGEPIRTELPTLLYVDPVGVLRDLLPFLPSTSRLPTSVEFHLAIDRGKARLFAAAPVSAEPAGAEAGGTGGGDERTKGRQSRR